MNYDAFVESKALVVPPQGFEPRELSAFLFPFQRDIVRWALRRGRAAICADCGMGKSGMQLEWARRVHEHTGGRILILAPLAVAKQTVHEGAKFGIPVKYVRDQSQVDASIVVANYEMLERFDPSAFAGVVLDESSILKAFDGKLRNSIIDAFQKTPFRLACTATPAPNDFMELGNHAEFLGAMSRAEMLSMFFVHDGGETQVWRLKGHAQREFWKWVCSWSCMIRSPADLGYDAGAFVLPALKYDEHIIPAEHRDAWAAGQLFVTDAKTLNEQRAARRASLERRVKAAADLANSNGEQWLVWCDLNDEGDALERSIDGAVQVAGADSQQEKEDRLFGFAEGRYRVLVSKPKIAGFGMNFQRCHNMAFVGLSHSYEALYQAVRRCWRFGQVHPVNVHIVTSEAEGAVLANVRRKEADAARMAEEMLGRMRAIQDVNIKGTERLVTEYAPKKAMALPSWLGSKTS